MEDGEDIYSDVDSDGFLEDMRSYGVAQALPLDDEGIDDDAAAYLRAVRDEASRMPQVTSSIRRCRVPEPPVQTHPDDTSMSHPAPVMEWIHSVVDGFIEARQQVQYQVQHGRPHTLSEAGEPYEQPVPAPYDRRAWQRRIQETDFQPFADTLSKMENNLAASCLCSLVDEVSNLCVPVATPGQLSPGIADAAADSGQGESLVRERLPPHLALWMYGLMVRLEQPVTPQVAAALRRIVTIAEAGLQRCRDGAATNSQDSSSGTDCAGDSRDIERTPQNAATATYEPDGAHARSGQQHACDLANSGGHAQGVQGVAGAEGAAYEAGGVVPGGGSAGDPVSGNCDVNMQAKNADVCMNSSCMADTDPDTVGRQGTAEEIARCDTLRVVAGGFFGQDSALAPLVHSYLFRDTAQA